MLNIDWRLQHTQSFRVQNTTNTSEQDTQQSIFAVPHSEPRANTPAQAPSYITNSPGITSYSFPALPSMITHEGEGSNHQMDNWAPQVSHNFDLSGSTERVHPPTSINEYPGTELYTSSSLNDNIESLQLQPLFNLQPEQFDVHRSLGSMHRASLPSFGVLDEQLRAGIGHAYNPYMVGIQAPFTPCTSAQSDQQRDTWI